ncbi:hypothetical protein JD77_00310 [Micromonospora olivasterospora]|uniref:Uncharacterized protein n=1 Tax=Micromonospora olivasterospora TaxID=1880 RepID=A0A562I3U7_MICOL|nr:hypothetical protein JD77_00310 [Micromonospora olivasterospora]
MALLDVLGPVALPGCVAGRGLGGPRAPRPERGSERPVHRVGHARLGVVEQHGAAAGSWGGAIVNR